MLHHIAEDLQTCEDVGYYDTSSFKHFNFFIESNLNYDFFEKWWYLQLCAIGDTYFTRFASLQNCAGFSKTGSLDDKRTVSDQPTRFLEQGISQNWTFVKTHKKIFYVICYAGSEVIAKDFRASFIKYKHISENFEVRIGPLCSKCDLGPA